VETVGAGQNEVDVVETAETVVVVVQPGSGDDIQLLKAGILEIGDIFVVNKADMDEAAGTVADLETMIHMDADPAAGLSTGHHGPDVADDDSGEGTTEGWTPPVIETIATTGDGVDDLRAALDDHREYLADSGEGDERRRQRAATEIRRLLRTDLGGLAERLLDRRGGVDALAASVAGGKTDPYTAVASIVDPIEAAVENSLGEEATDREHTKK
ncbi:MAG: methylmalonyl Co-A mutase-associated GTPase MeaB, partial [Halohasta sp.]